MKAAERKRLIAFPIALAVTAGLAWAGGQGGASVGGVPVFWLCAALALAINWAAFVPAYWMRTEHFFDLTGSLTYLSITGLAIALRPAVDERSILLATLVAVWAARLGTFLYRRIRAAGSDRRFDEIKTSLVRFLFVWTLQGVWVCFTAGAALAAITSDRAVPMDALGWVGLTLWLAGFGLEVVADRQKQRFRARPENADRFISSGVWAWSRHPNYFGEIVLWVGVALVALPVLNGWQYVTLLSPVFVALLLTRASGIPLLEQRADEKWGGDPEYEAYKASTPVLVPRPPAEAH